MSEPEASLLCVTAAGVSLLLAVVLAGAHTDTTPPGGYRYFELLINIDAGLSCSIAVHCCRTLYMMCCSKYLCHYSIRASQHVLHALQEAESCFGVRIDWLLLPATHFK